jgi:hypothetical protein
MHCSAAGWRKEDLVAGTQLVVDGFQARNGATTANATSITFTDGRKLFAGSSQGATQGGIVSAYVGGSLVSDKELIKSSDAAAETGRLCSVG